MTLRELVRAFVVAHRLHVREMERDLSLAWHAANFQRAKKLPELKTVLAKVRVPQKQTRRHHLAALQELSQQYGLPLRNMKLVKSG